MDGTGLFRASDDGVTLGWIVLASGIRGVASDEQGASKGGFVVKEETGQPGPGDSGNPAGSGGSGTPAPTATPAPPQDRCRDFIAGGCQMSCADLQRLHAQQKSAGVRALVRAQMQEIGCPPPQSPSSGTNAGSQAGGTPSSGTGAGSGGQAPTQKGAAA